MKLLRNQRWIAPEWRQPKTSPADLISAYAGLIQPLPGVKGLWADVRHGTIHFYTLVEDDTDSRKGVFDAELAFWDAWDDAPVEFHVHGSKKAILEMLGAAEPVLIDAP